MKTKIYRALTVLLLSYTAASAAVPDFINFQGRLLDSNKRPKSGNFSVTFNICALPTGGCLWTEDKTIAAANGVFAVQLGTTNALTPAVFAASERYLELIVNGEALTPREQLAAAPYSLRAAAADSLAANVPVSSVAVAAVYEDALLDGAVTSAKLFGAIPDTKLSQVSTANKVATSAIADGALGSLVRASSVAVNSITDSAIVGVSGSKVGSGVAAANIADGDLGANVIASSVAVGSVYAEAIVAVAGSKVSGNIPGNAANVTGTVVVGNGGTGAITAPLARTALAVPGLADANTFTSPTASPILIKPSGAPGANTKLFDMQATGVGGTNFSVDAEGDVTATSFSGPLTGNVTGNASGTAATVTEAAQTAITSVGTLTGLTMGGALAMGANNITMTGALGATGAGRLSKGWFTDLDVTNAVTAAGITSPAGTALTLDSNSTESVNIGTNANAKTITIGNGTLGTSLVLNAGTGNIDIGNNAFARTVNLGTGGAIQNLNIGGTFANVIRIGDTQSAGSISLGAAMVGGTIGLGGTAQTGAIDIGNPANTAAQTINIGTGGTGAKAINIGGGAQAGAITIGGGSQTGAINLGDGSGTQTLNLGTGVTNPKTINIGTGAGMTNPINIGGTGANAIRIADTQAAGYLSLGAAMTGANINIGGTGAQTGNIDIGAGTGAQKINIGTGGTGAKTIAIGTGTVANTISVGGNGANVITIGNAQADGSIALGAAMVGGTIGLGGTAQTGAIDIGNPANTAAQTINIGTGGTGVKTISIGGTAANVVGIGNTQTAGSISLGAAMTGGTIALGGNGTNAITIGGIGAQTGAIGIGPGTGAQTISLGTNASGAKTILIGNALNTTRVGIGEASPADVLHISTLDTGSTVRNVLRLQRTDSDSVGAAGLGAGIDTYLEDSASNINQAARQDVVWDDATDASEDASVRFNVMSAGALTEAMRVQGSGIRVTPAALPGSPITGDIVIDSGDTNALKWYDGSVWRENPQRIAGNSGAAGARETWQNLTANSANCTTTALCAAAMTTTGVGVGTWKFVYTFIYQTAATGTGIAFGINHTGTVGKMRAAWRHTTTGTTATTGIGDSAAATNAGQTVEGKSGLTLNAVLGSASAGVDTANTDILAVLEGIIVVTASGDLELKLGSESAGTAVRLMADSTLELKKIE